MKVTSLAVTLSLILVAGSALAQSQTGGTGTTSGPAVGTPANMDSGNGTGMTASPHQKSVLKHKHKTTGTGDQPTNTNAQDNSDPQNAPRR